ncbi:hypothetical protein B0T16DRAFT_448241 [Cercophora newfieldiana]|uniref:Uncharacterized protein n=1 Tax=Cercophora newfieldiana TaxID=92897 RepID=A0AA40CN85_9PEZI|nr:hypothetical protein B0T16DRAFT_448241 [Cercophora newfieldiana]
MPMLLSTFPIASMTEPDDVGYENNDSPTGIPLGAKLTTRFYLLLILHESLKKIFKKAEALRMPDIETVPTDVFKTFVNKLAHICDSAKGGEKATAFVVMQLGTIRYYFTSNKRDKEDYQRTSLYVTGILKSLGQATDDEVRSQDGNDGSLPIFSDILRRIIGFNQSRITGYIGRMSEKIDACIDSAQQDPSPEGRTVFRSLKLLRPLLQFLEDWSGTLEEFVDRSYRVIHTINQIYTPTLKEFLRQRTQNITDREAPWVAVHHSIGRLLSYHYAVKILLAARRDCPQLFVDFEVHWFPSSEARRVSIPRGKKLNAAFIIGKMTNDAKEIAMHRSFVRDIENSGFPLNSTIHSKACDPYFLPYVHAEVNLLDNILRLQNPSPSPSDPDGISEIPQFFLDNRYIGTSKPTCRLCELTFTHHPSGIQAREGHRGLYPDWRMPDVFTTQAAEERQKILNHIIPLVRDEVFANLKGKFASRRPHDSRNTPSSLPEVGILSAYGSVHGGLAGDNERWEPVDMGDLVSDMGQMSVYDPGEQDAREGVRDRGEVVSGIGRLEDSEGFDDRSPSQTPELTDGSTGEEFGNDELDSDDDGGGAML